MLQEQVLKDEIEYRGISQRKLAAAMDVPYTLLNEVMNGKRPVNTELALLIEATLDLPAEPLLRMQARYNLLTTKRNTKFIEKLNRTRKIFQETSVSTCDNPKIHSYN